MLIFAEILKKQKTYRRKDNHGLWLSITRQDGESKTRLSYVNMALLTYNVSQRWVPGNKLLGAVFHLHFLKSPPHTHPRVVIFNKYAL